MYQHTDLTVPAREITHLLREAMARMPDQCNGSFIVPYPFVPDCFADAHVLRLLVVGLLPNQQIAAHCDASIAPAVRYHIPLQTFPGCWSYHDGLWQQLETGRVYRMDPTKPHGAVNWDSGIRLHLMIDVEAP